jgi:hypothetical protein
VQGTTKLGLGLRVSATVRLHVARAPRVQRCWISPLIVRSPTRLATRVLRHNYSLHLRVDQAGTSLRQDTA